MSNFEVNICKVNDVYNHPNADRLNIVKINEYNCISAKLSDGSPRYNPGDIVVYVPEASIVPDNLLKLGFWDNEKNKGILNGKDGNRVKALKLRGIISQGIIFSIDDVKDLLKDNDISVGKNVADLLNIKKYEPEIPSSMSGEVMSLFGKTLKYDIENYKKYPNVFEENELVAITEKLHGTYMCACYYPGLENSELFFNGNAFCYSKGLGAQGLVFKNNENNKNNIYVRTLNTMIEDGLFEKLSQKYNHPIYIMVEIFGKGIQDLNYGLDKPSYRVFDVYDKEINRYLNVEEFFDFCQSFGLYHVPVLYEGPFSKSIIDDLKEGNTSFGYNHVREGVVIKPMTERRDDTIGRVILKHVGDGYLTRSGQTTEFN